LFDSGKELFGSGFSGFTLVVAFSRLGDAVASIPPPPCLDGSPGELMGDAFLVFENLPAYSDVASLHGVSVGELKCAEDFHF